MEKVSEGARVARYRRLATKPLVVREIREREEMIIKGERVAVLERYISRIEQQNFKLRLGNRILNMLGIGSGVLASLGYGEVSLALLGYGAFTGFLSNYGRNRVEDVRREVEHQRDYLSQFKINLTSWKFK